MNSDDTGQTSDWAARGCTLPPSRLLARTAEFDTLFAESVQSIERPERTRVRLELRPGGLAASRAAELAAAETECCSFFTFTLTAAAGRLILDVSVPPTHEASLNLLAARAAACVAT